MTRETKIGLLVGLAFIIVIGILLSDHLTNSTEAPPAVIGQTTQRLRESIAFPGGDKVQHNAPVVVSAPVTQHTVPTPRDIQKPTKASDIVTVGGPGAVPEAPPTGNSIVFVKPDSSAGQPTPDPIAAEIPIHPLARIAEAHGEKLVSANDPSGTAQTTTPVTLAPGNVPPMGFKEYTAQAGDNVSKMAQKFLGNKGKAAQEAIVKANPSLQQDPNKVIEGRVYRIPISVSPAPITTASAPAPQPTAPIVTASAPPSTGENWYTVKDGDSLWRIANDQLGNPKAVDAIKELNRDLLQDSNNIQIGMKLKLPGKSIARVN